MVQQKQTNEDMTKQTNQQKNEIKKTYKHT